MQCKANPNNDAQLSFPGFQRIKDFTAVGGETQLSLDVNSDTDLEYIVYQARIGGSPHTSITLNDDGGSKYGDQYLINGAGSISAAMDALTYLPLVCYENGISFLHLITPVGFIKLFNYFTIKYGTGTTINAVADISGVVNITANITSIKFKPLTSTFLAGDRIIVLARRSQT